VVYDLVGGVVANGLNSAKRFQHADRIPVPRRAAALVRNHVLFATIHVQPILVAKLVLGAVREEPYRPVPISLSQVRRQGPPRLMGPAVS